MEVTATPGDGRSLRRGFYFLVNSQYRTAAATKPTKPLLPSELTSPIILPTTSPGKNATDGPKIIWTITAKAIKDTPTSVSLLTHPKTVSTMPAILIPPEVLSIVHN